MAIVSIYQLFTKQTVNLWQSLQDSDILDIRSSTAFMTVWKGTWSRAPNLGLRVVRWRLNWGRIYRRENERILAEISDPRAVALVSA